MVHFFGMLEATLGSAMPSLSKDQIAQYEQDGFIILPGFFTKDEIEPLRRACHADPDVGGAIMAYADSKGQPQEVVAYTDLSDDLVGILPRMTRLIDATEALIGEPIYHWHSKLSMKQPRSTGTWDWHQDYGFWYYQGVLRPAMVTAGIAVDACTPRNGCMKLVRGSHHLGRMDHGKLGDATSVEAGRLEHVLASHEVVDCTLDVGDTVFFHCNTLHASGPNESKAPRTIIHCSYNAVANSPYLTGQEAHSYRPIERVADDALRARAYRSVFDHQVFIASDGDSGYGYKILRESTRPGQPSRAGVARSLN